MMIYASDVWSAELLAARQVWDRLWLPYSGDDDNFDDSDDNDEDYVYIDDDDLGPGGAGHGASGPDGRDGEGTEGIQRSVQMLVSAHISFIVTQRLHI